MTNQKMKEKSTMSQNIKRKISNQVRDELPKIHCELLRKFKGKHALINNFICIPDIFNGSDIDALKSLNISTYNVNDFLKCGNFKYELINISFDKSMRLRFEYFIEDQENELYSKVVLVEGEKGWKVKKIEPFRNLY